MIEGNFIVGGIISNKGAQFNMNLLGGFSIFLPIYDFLSTPKLVHVNVLSAEHSFSYYLNSIHNYLRIFL